MTSIRVDRNLAHASLGRRSTQTLATSSRILPRECRSRPQNGNIALDVGTKLYVDSAKEWRRWLVDHGASERDIWLVFYKKGSGRSGISLSEAIEEALCFGWVDSQMKGIDAASYALRFTPRGRRSSWSTRNRELARQLIADGRMSERGQAALPSDWHDRATHSDR